MKSKSSTWSNKRKLVFHNGSWAEGDRTTWCVFTEPSNCMRIIVKDSSEDLKCLIGKMVTAPQTSLKYWHRA